MIPSVIACEVGPCFSENKGIRHCKYDVRPSNFAPSIPRNFRPSLPMALTIQILGAYPSFGNYHALPHAFKFQKKQYKRA
jgi:hypothetical protein